MADNLLEQDIWSTGNQKSRADSTRNMLMTSTHNYGKLFQKKVKGVEDIEKVAPIKTSGETHV